MKFKVGDRVRVYGHLRSSDCYFSRGHKATITAVIADDEIMIQFGTELNSFEGEVHPNQCRKLKKKEREPVPSNLGPFAYTADGRDVEMAEAVNFLLDCERKRGRGK